MRLVQREETGMGMVTSTSPTVHPGDQSQGAGMGVGPGMGERGVTVSSFRLPLSFRCTPESL